MNSTNTIIKTLEKAQNVLLVTEDSKTNDGIASLLALQAVLSRAGKEVLSICPSKVPDNHKFLMGADFVKDNLVGEGDFVISLSTQSGLVDHVKYVTKDDAVDILISAKKGTFKPQDVEFKTNGGKYDAVVVLATESLEQLGAVFLDNTELFADSLLINIDASPANEHYGKVNLVDPKLGSTTELIYDIIDSSEELSPYLDSAVSTMLLTGIIGHTESFLDKNTSAKTFAAAASLQEKGADHQGIIQHLVKMKSYATLKLWAKVFQNLSFSKSNDFVWSRVTKNDFELTGATYNNIKEISDLILKNIDGSQMSILFVERNNDVLVQVRAGQKNLPWGAIQALFNKEGLQKKHGLDFIFEDTSLYEVESTILRGFESLVQEQVVVNEDESPEEKSSKKQKKVVSKNKDFPMMQTFKAGKSHQEQKAPDHIPFEAPQKESKKEES